MSNDVYAFVPGRKQRLCMWKASWAAGLTPSPLLSGDDIVKHASGSDCCNRWQAERLARWLGGERCVLVHENHVGWVEGMPKGMTEPWMDGHMPDDWDTFWIGLKDGEIEHEPMVVAWSAPVSEAHEVEVVFSVTTETGRSVSGLDVFAGVDHGQPAEDWLMVDRAMIRPPPFDREPARLEAMAARALRDVADDD